jgi:hypothetical protein
MTRRELENVIDSLVEIAYSWNQGAADEDRGPDSSALCLTLFDDGSGRLGRRRWTGIPGNLDVEDYYDFNNLEELARVLEDECVEFEDEIEGDVP